MYRYSMNLRGNRGGSRAQQILMRVALVLLVIVVVVLIVLGTNAMYFKQQTNAELLDSLRYEANQVFTQFNSLSRLGGSEAPYRLGRIRQHVYAMQQVTEIYASLYGASHQLIQAGLLTETINIIETYNTNLTTGATFTETHQQLLNNVSKIQEEVLKLSE